MSVIISFCLVFLYVVNSHKKSPLFQEALLFVFAFFITRRNASQSGEGKKECEEKRFTGHVLSKNVRETGFKVTAGFYLCQ
ncbi:hypothetical protein D4100_23010 [Serratia inhibens]|uniref:Uncharacterized protein n=1 Tax=Serratia inhibens TaxID=2338073 RepID=A0AA92X1U6_9GAMM|nr:hypothetical protein D4100_23010 [Serratia inhibens]